MRHGWILTAHPNPTRFPHFPFTKFLLIFLLLMASFFSLTRSIHFQPVCFPKPSLLKPHFPSYPYSSLKSRTCPLSSSSFSTCLLQSRASTPHRHLRKAIGTNSIRASSPSFRSFCVSALSSGPDMAENESNPLLKDFEFPPFDLIEAKHVRPGIRALLKQLVGV